MNAHLARGVLTAVFALFLVLGFAARADSSTAPARDVSGAQAIVRRFYAWYMRTPRAYKQLADPASPAKSWFDDELMWMLRQTQQTHPLAKPRRGFECQDSEEPFGLGSGGGKISRFVTGAVRRRGELYMVPVAIYLVIERRGPIPLPPVNMAVVVEKSGGRYKLYDFQNRAYHVGLRSALTDMARDPNCAWSR